MITLEKKFIVGVSGVTMGVPVTLLVSTDGGNGAYISVQVNQTKTVLRAVVETTTTGGQVNVSEEYFSEE